MSRVDSGRVHPLVILVSPAEPAYLRTLGPSHPLPESYGVDFLASLPSGKLAGIQRKEFPCDLLASLTDGRLALDLMKMQDLDVRILLLEGRGHWTTEGHLLTDFKTDFTRKRLQSLILSCQFEHGTAVIQTEDQDHTAKSIPQVFAWLKSTPHNSLRTRPKAPNPFLSGGSSLWQEWLMQSFHKCGPGHAARIVEHFGRAPLAWTCSRGELIQVPGVGKTLADQWLACLPPVTQERLTP